MKKIWSCLVVFLLGTILIIGGIDSKNKNYEARNHYQNSLASEFSENTDQDASSILNSTENEDEVNIIKLDGPFVPNVAKEDIPITYGVYKPSEFIYSFAMSSSPQLIEDEMMGSKLTLGEHSLELEGDLLYSYEDVDYQKAVQLDQLDPELQDEFSRYVARLSDGTLHEIGELCLGNGESTLYDVYTAPHICPYKILVYKDKIWLLRANGNFRDQFSTTLHVDSITEYILQ